MALRVLLGVEPDLLGWIVAAAFTYALHALVWCGAALVALASRACAPAARHRLWKLALFGPCVTAPMAALAPSHFGRLLDGRVVSLGEVHVASSQAATHTSWPAWLACGLVVAVGIGLVRFAHTLMALGRRLRSRVRVHDPRVLKLLEPLCARARCSGVVLSESTEIDVPLVVGLRELCVPRDMLKSLDDSALAAVLGHELAHLERRDGLWFPVAGLLECALWMQPLQRWVGAHFRETAELACDDRAVQLTGDPVALARALVQVAQRALAAQSRGQSALVPTMAGSGSVLRARVQRLHAGWRPPPSAARLQDWSRVLASLGLCALASLGLSVRFRQVTAALPVSAAVALQSERLDTLLRRDRELQSRLAQAELWSEDHHDDRELAVWKAELEQELRHLRAEAAWTEQRVTGP